MTEGPLKGLLDQMAAASKRALSREVGFERDGLGQWAGTELRMTTVEPSQPRIVASDDPEHDETTCPACALIREQTAGRLAPGMVLRHADPVPVGMGPEGSRQYEVQVVAEPPRVEIPEDERRRMAESAARGAELAAAAKASTAEWLPKLAAITDPLSLKIFELHGYETGYHEVVCVGCDVDGYEAEQPPWPCRTVRLVAEHHGMPAPEWVEFDE